MRSDVARKVASIELSPAEKRSTLYETGSAAHAGETSTAGMAIRPQIPRNVKRMRRTAARVESYAKTDESLRASRGTQVLAF